MSALIISLYALGALGLVFVSWLSHRDDAPSAALNDSAAPVADGESARPHRREPGIPRFADIAGFVMAYRVGRVPVGRIAVLGFWWWVGWHFFAR